MRNEGSTIILATNELQEADVLSDRVAIMHKGKIVAMGKTDYIKSLVKSSEIVTCEIKNPTPQIISCIEKLEGVISVTSSQPSPESCQLKIQVKEKEIAPKIAITCPQI
jgi:ABC-2 type transport system ATP-binding protein